MGFHGWMFVCLLILLLVFLLNWQQISGENLVVSIIKLHVLYNTDTEVSKEYCVNQSNANISVYTTGIIMGSKLIRKIIRGNHFFIFEGGYVFCKEIIFIFKTVLYNHILNTQFLLQCLQSFKHAHLFIYAYTCAAKIHCIISTVQTDKTLRYRTENLCLIL